MAVEENKALIRRLYDDVVNAGNSDALSELLAADYVGHSPDVADGFGGTSRGVAAVAGDVAAMRTMLTDVQVTLEDLVASGDRVAVRGVTRGTHSGAVAGITPTGNAVTMTWSAIYRVADGKIVESWQNADDLSTFQQLGIIPRQ